MQTIQFKGQTYEIENGLVFVIKTRWQRNGQGRTWRHRITSLPKIRKLLKLAAAEMEVVL